MKITKNEILKVLRTMLVCFIAAAIYYFIYNVDAQSANTLAVLCLSGDAFIRYKKKKNSIFLHK